MTTDQTAVPPRDQAGARLDLAEFLRPGDRIVWGQACAEPQTLTGLLAAQRHRLPEVSCFVGIPAAATFTPAHGDRLRFVSYCGTGGNQALHAAGMLDIVAEPYSRLPRLLAGGLLAADVVFVQVSAADADGRHSLGLADDYFSAALDSARVVIAEVNDQVPFTYGARTLTSGQWTASVRTSRPPAELPDPPASSAVTAVAAQVAALVPDGATLQFGIGTLPAACLDALHDHRDLGIHSGIINDAAMRLVQSGAVTGALKTVDPGVAVGGLLGGTAELFAFAHRNPHVSVLSTAYTHDPQVLARQRQLVAINSALEVDLSGQVNAETAGGRYVGAVGGAADFLRGAAASPGGIPVIALPSTVGAASRIVARLSGPVSTARADAGVIVTEFGSADLRGLPLSRRYERMLAIAHPAHRDALAADFEESLMSGARV